MVDDAAGLAWIVNLGCIELHPHSVKSGDLDHPDELVELLWQCSSRVQDAVERGLSSRGMRTRYAERITHGLWGTVHGHASLELRGLLGPPRQAESVWRTTIHAIVSATFPDR